MLIKNITKQPKSLVDIQITVPWADLEAKWTETLTKLAADLELPGFRKGQVPLPMAETNLGNKLQEEFLKMAMPQALIEALKDTQIIPIDYPKYQVLSFTKGQPLQFKAQITEKPEIKVGDFHNIRAVKPPLKQVTEADVDKLIDDLYKRWKTRQTSSPLQPESDKVAGTTGSLSFNQPASTGLVDASGKPLINTTPDQPDDSFAKAVGAASLADLKSRMKTDLETEAKNNNELDYEEAILQEVEKITTVEIPDVLVEDELKRMLVSLQRRVADMGLLLEDYLKNQGQTTEGLKSSWRGQAEKNVRMELGLAEIAKMQNVTITDQEVQAEVDKIPDARMKAQFEAAEPRLHLKHSLRQIRTLDLLKSLVKPS